MSVSACRGIASARPPAGYYSAIVYSLDFASQNRSVSRCSTQKNPGQNQKRLAGDWPHFVKPITPDKRVFRFESSRVNALAIRSPLTKQPIEIASPKKRSLRSPQSLAEAYRRNVVTRNEQPKRGSGISSEIACSAYAHNLGYLFFCFFEN